MILLDGIYSTVVVREILEREKRRGQRQITDPVLLRKIILFLADNIGSTVSVSSIGNTLVNEGLLEDGKRKGTPSAHTVQAYVSALMESYFFYDIKQFDIKGKEYLRTLGKFYIVDMGFGIICWASVIGTAATHWKMWYILNCSAEVMMLPSARWTMPRWTSLPPNQRKSCIFR